MLKVINSKVTYVWLFLAVLTGASWVLGDGYDPASPEMFKVFSISLLVLAFFKIRLVVMHFMEVGHAPLVLRLILESWIVLVFGLLTLLYLFGSSLNI